MTKEQILELIDEDGNLNLKHRTDITELFGDLTVNNLNLYGCSNLTSIGENITVYGYADLDYCTSLKNLPFNFNVSGDLYINDCKSLHCLPPELSVGGNLSMIRCDKILNIPHFAKVKGTIFLRLAVN